MSEGFFNELKIKKLKYNLEVNAKSHLVQVAKMMIKLEEILIFKNPDLVLI
jgi:UDP-N-acetylglucosamine 2-epimerase